MTIIKLAVDEPIPELFKIPKNLEGGRIIISEDFEITLVMAYPNITEKELLVIKLAQKKFHLAEVENFIFVNLQFVNNPLGCEFPFHAGSYYEPIKTPNLSSPESRLAVSIIIVDSSTMLVKHLKICTWSHQFSKEFVRLFKKHHATKISKEGLEIKLESLYKKYSVLDIFSRNIISCHAGD